MAGGCLKACCSTSDGQQETAQAAEAACVGAGWGAAAGGGVVAVGTDSEQQQQQGQALPAVSKEGLLTSRAVTQLAASPALWAAAWGQLAAFCQGMYTWQGERPAKAQPSSSSRSKSSKSSSLAGNSDLAGMFAMLQIFPDHEQVAAAFAPGEISARIEALDIPAKGRPFSKTALAKAVGHGFVAPAAFLDTVLAFHDRSVLCEGLNLQQGASESEVTGSRAGGNCSSGGGSSRGRNDSGGMGKSSGGGSSSGRNDSGGMGNGSGGGSSSGRNDSGGMGNSSGGGSSSGRGNSAGGSSWNDRGGGGSSNAIRGAGEIISRTSTGSSSGEGISCSSGRAWSSSRGGVAPAAALQLMLEAAVLLGVVDRLQETTAAVMILFTTAKNCSIEPRKCLLSTRGDLVLDVLSAAARYEPESFVDPARYLLHIFLDGAGEGV